MWLKQLKYCFADNFWRWNQDRELLTWKATDISRWISLVRGGWNGYYARLTPDHWGFDLTVSNLDSVARGEWVPRWRCQSRGNNTGQLNEEMEWQAFYYPQLSTWDLIRVGGRGSNSISFGFEISMFGTVVEEAKKLRNLLRFSLKDPDFRPLQFCLGL